MIVRCLRQVEAASISDQVEQLSRTNGAQSSQSNESIASRSRTSLRQGRPIEVKLHWSKTRMLSLDEQFRTSISYSGRRTRRVHVCGSLLRCSIARQIQWRSTHRSARSIQSLSQFTGQVSVTDAQGRGDLYESSLGIPMNSPKRCFVCFAITRSNSISSKFYSVCRRIGRWRRSHKFSYARYAPARTRSARRKSKHRSVVCNTND